MSRHRRITDWHVARLRAAYRRTASVPAAARAAGVSLPTAYRVLAEELKPVVHVYKTRLRQEAKRLYASGMSCREVARELAKTHSPTPTHESIRGWMAAAGILRGIRRALELRAIRERGKDYDRIRAIARRLSNEKQLSPSHIARVLGVQKSVIRRVLDRDQRLDSAEATLRRNWQADLPDVHERLRKRELVVTLRERGATYPQIKATTGLSAATVYKYLREAGLTKATRRSEVRA